jgi:hypothetical protein
MLAQFLVESGAERDLAVLCFREYGCASSTLDLKLTISRGVRRCRRRS